MTDSADNPDLCRRRVIFHGRVQGVGFRFTTQRIARRHPVSGYVKNLSNGTVELDAQGSPTSINSFLEEVEDRFRGNITDRETTELEPTRESANHFRIEY